MRFQISQSYSCDFLIVENGRTTLVRLQPAQRMRDSVDKIERDYSDSFGKLSTITGGRIVSRELWIYSRAGALRFFRSKTPASPSSILLGILS